MAPEAIEPARGRCDEGGGIGLETEVPGLLARRPGAGGPFRVEGRPFGGGGIGLPLMGADIMGAGPGGGRIPVTGVVGLDLEEVGVVDRLDVL